MKRTYATEEWHDFARRVREQFDEHTRGEPKADRLYKMFVHGAPGGVGMRVACWTKRLNLYCMSVSNRNMSRTAIESRWQPHAVNMLIGPTGNLQRFAIAPATQSDLDRYSRVWPGTLVLPR